MSESFLSLYSDTSNSSGRVTSKLIDVGSPVLDSIEAFGASEAKKHFDDYVVGLDLSEQSMEFAEESKLSVARRCVNSLQRIRRSLDNDSPVLISFNLALDKGTWDLQIYQQSDDFTVENVPLKINVIKTLSQTLEEYLLQDRPQFVETVARTLQYLNKLVQASLLSNIQSHLVAPPLSMGPPVRRPGNQERDVTHRSVISTKRVPNGNGSDSMSLNSTKSTGNKSISSTKSKRSIFQKMKGMSRWSQHISHENAPNLKNIEPRKQKMKSPATKIKSSSPAPTNLNVNKIHYKKQDFSSMPSYLYWIRQLAKQVLLLPQTSQNDIVFSFINKCIVPFIVNDGHLLQIQVIQKRVLSSFLR
ncbi:unnamed protein product [Kluyveromyces dobzhanskii CBS 2104]|uniref:WGS project CCBQ000000000 data, contig 00011 n=1 Tax=Kluyveromyces dobzhanskii CBS 2104 TaxID=1427455 RepID=A0A0A8L9X7_9SACH|nr:unnamed protein product [Kluyveromyces dobzhanskii CBS 2104]